MEETASRVKNTGAGEGRRTALYGDTCALKRSRATESARAEGDARPAGRECATPT